MKVPRVSSILKAELGLVSKRDYLEKMAFSEDETVDHELVVLVPESGDQVIVLHRETLVLGYERHAHTLPPLTAEQARHLGGMLIGAANAIDGNE
jgi:hypothetical protein